MTREELVEELNKIDRVKAFAHENNVHIDIGIMTTSLCYKWDTNVVDKENNTVYASAYIEFVEKDHAYCDTKGE